jgi:chemotaxis protein histidine kinase CheA
MSHTSNASDFQQTLQNFRDEFAQQVPGRVAEARERLQACRSDPANDALVRDFYRSVHKLAGSAGTFGMTRLGDDARTIELRIETLLGQGQRSADDFEALVPGVEALAPAA